MIEQACGSKPKFSYNDQHRVGDHICYYSDLTKLRAHVPEWRIKYTLPQFIDEMVALMSDRAKA